MGTNGDIGLNIIQQLSTPATQTPQISTPPEQADEEIFDFQSGAQDVVASPDAADEMVMAQNAIELFGDLFDIDTTELEQYEEGYTITNEKHSYADDKTTTAIPYNQTSEIIATAEQAAAHLIDKYGLDIDMNSITDEEIEMLQKLSYIDSMPSAYEDMKEYETTLGWVDTVYDGCKDLFGTGLTKEDIELYAQHDATRRDLLAASIINGSLTISDKTTDTTVSLNDYLDLSQEIMSCMGPEDMVDYAIRNLGYSEEEAVEVLKNKVTEAYATAIYSSNDGTQPSESMIEYYGSCISVEKDETTGKFIITTNGYIPELVDEDDPSVDKFLNDNPRASLDDIAQEFSNGAKIQSGTEVSFENLYSAFTGVEYNEQAIQELNSMKPTYDAASQVYQDAFSAQDKLRNINDPAEALEYFNELATQRNDGKTGVQLFNEYYAEVFDYARNNGDLLHDIGDARSGLRIDSIVMNEDGTVTTTYKVDDPNNEQFLSDLENDFYTYNKETGLITRSYDITIDTPSGDMNVFGMVNENIADKNLYMLPEIDKFNEQFKDLIQTKDGSTFNLFSAVMVSYDDMYSQAMGVNVLGTKLGEYIHDMDTYTSEMASTISKIGFVLSWIPGMQALGMLSLIGSYSDNVLDAVNVLTSHDKNKSEKMDQWFLQTGEELVGTAAGFGINKLASFVGGNAAALYLNSNSSASGNVAKFISTAAEYGTDVTASIGWDLMTYAVKNKGQLPEGEALQGLILQNAIFNSSDLRGGMALYKALNSGGDEVSLGGGRTIQFDSENNATYRTYGADGELLSENFTSADGSIKTMAGNDPAISFDVVNSKESFETIEDPDNEYTVETDSPVSDIVVDNDSTGRPNIQEPLNKDISATAANEQTLTIPPKLSAIISDETAAKLQEAGVSERTLKGLSSVYYSSESQVENFLQLKSLGFNEVQALTLGYKVSGETIGAVGELLGTGLTVPTVCQIINRATVTNLEDLNSPTRISFGDEQLSVFRALDSEQVEELNSLMDPSVPEVSINISRNFDVLNLILNGKPVDEELQSTVKEIGKKHGISIKIDNNTTSDPYDYSFGRQQVSKNYLNAIDEALALMKSNGKDLPPEIYLTDMLPFMDNGDDLTVRAGGVFRNSCPNAISLTLNLADQDLPFLQVSLFHENTHRTDYAAAAAKGQSGLNSRNRFAQLGLNSYERIQYISRKGTILFTNDDIGNFIRPYAASQPAEFVAEIGGLTTYGTIVWDANNSRYMMNQDRIPIGYCRGWVENETNIKKLNDMMSFYNYLTQ